MNPPSPLLIGDRFELLEQAGAGGMGTVYRARDRLGGGIVAVKLMKDAGQEPQDGERFLREAQFLSELRHPGIVGYVAHGFWVSGSSAAPAGAFLAMDWLEGESLADRLRSGPLSLSESLRLLQQTAKALAVAHQRGIVHGDLKPSNLFLPDRQIDQVTLLDFGLARRWRVRQSLTGSEPPLGTLDYMAPEQARGEREISPAADIFSLGSVIYECLAGQPPFRAGQLMATLAKILLETPRPLSDLRSGLPSSVGSLVSHMLDKDPAARPADAMALLAEMTRLYGQYQRDRISGSFCAVAMPSAALAVDGEQRLISVVLAALPPGQESSPDDGGPQAALAAALTRSGAECHFLLDQSLIATFSGDGSAIDQASRAGRCALLTVEQWPHAVVVMATGRATSIGRLSMGQAIERATELLIQRCLDSSDGRAAHRSAVWLDELSAGLLSRSFSISQASDGSPILREPLPLDHSRRLLGRPTTCVGRESELQALVGRLRTVCLTARACCVVTVAPPGIGKTRLYRELVRRWHGGAGQGIEVELHAARPEPLGGAAPFGLLASILRRICLLGGQESIEVARLKLGRLTQHLPATAPPPDLAILGELCGVPAMEPMKSALATLRLDPTLYQQRLRAAFGEFLGAESAWRPQLLVLDDLHAADPASIDLLLATLSALAARPIMILGLARPEVRALLPQLFDGRSIELTLPPLARLASERLLRLAIGGVASPAVIDRLAEQAGGNPLFLEEMVRATALGKGERIPETVTAMLQARLARLAPEARRILRLASVWGESFRAADVALLVGTELDEPTLHGWLASLRSSEFLEPLTDLEAASPAGSSLRFSHGLLREAAYGLLSTEERVSAHAIAAWSTERHGGAPLHYRRALAALDEQLDSRPVRRRQVELLIALARVTRPVEPAAANLARLDRAGELLSASRSPETADADRALAIQVDYWRGIFLLDSQKPQQAMALFQQIIDDNLADEELLLLPASLLGRAYALAGQFGRAVWLLDKLHQVLQSDPLAIDGQLLICIGFWGGSLVAVGDGQRGIELARRATLLARQRDELSLVAGTLGLLGAAYMLHGDFQAAQRVLSEGVAAAEQSASVLYLYLNSCLLGWAWSRLGDPAAAQASLARADEFGQKLGRERLLSDWQAAIRAELALTRGEPELAVALATEAVAVATASGGLFARGLARRVWAAGLAQCAPVSWPTVEEQLAHSLRSFESGQAVLEAARTQALWGQLGLRLGDPVQARQRLKTAAATFARLGRDAEHAAVQAALGAAPG